ncbi:MAG: purine-nucleoside phosphorylase [Cyclobacteriaceae bacterium]|nr:purine-nucleoside phosphorylase [Cyclobacteriaceae bacterium]
MSLHLEAKEGDIAPIVLITGDPLRSKYHAETILSSPYCYNRIRGMFGYTGMYRDKNISIQGTGIGIPSTALYVHELVHSYGVKCIIRVGTCGAIRKDIGIGQIIVATGAQTDSNTSSLLSADRHFMPTASNTLLNKAIQVAHTDGIPIEAGKVFSTDLFYSENDPDRWTDPMRDGVIAVDMETSVLYTLATKYQFQSLSILTVSDNIITGETANAESREKGTAAMIKLALEIIRGTC